MAARATKGCPFFQPPLQSRVVFHDFSHEKIQLFFGEGLDVFKGFSELGLLAKCMTTFLRMSFSIWERMLLDSGILRTFEGYFTTEAQRAVLNPFHFKIAWLCLRGKSRNRFTG